MKTEVKLDSGLNVEGKRKKVTERRGCNDSLKALQGGGVTKGS